MHTAANGKEHQKYTLNMNLQKRRKPSDGLSSVQQTLVNPL